MGYTVDINPVKGMEMIKKDKLKSASGAVESGKTTNKTVTGDNKLARAFAWICARPRAIWNWIRSLDVGALANAALMSLIIVLFAILTINLHDAREVKDGRGGSVMFKNATAERTPPAIQPTVETPKMPVRTATVAATVTFDANDMTVTIKAPMKDVLPPAVTSMADSDTDADSIPTLPLKKTGKPIAGTGNVVYLDNDGDVIIDGANYGNDLRPMRDIRGNVFLQNMRNYTLPCGLRIRGDLIVRNVRMLKFCGCFQVDGNIYVSTDSSFGPIPRDARLAGQIIL